MCRGAEGKETHKTCVVGKKQFFAFFGRTDLRICLSGAKFDEEADFEVPFALAPPKPYQINENLISETKKSSSFQIVFFDVWGVAKRRRRLKF